MVMKSEEYMWHHLPQGEHSVDQHNTWADYDLKIKQNKIQLHGLITPKPQMINYWWTQIYAGIVRS